MSDWDISCRGKAGYLTWDAANKAMSRSRFRPDPREGTLTPYRCRHCGCWHIGKSSHAKRKRR